MQLVKGCRRVPVTDVYGRMAARWPFSGRRSHHAPTGEMSRSVIRRLSGGLCCIVSPGYRTVARVSAAERCRPTVRRHAH